MGSCILYQLRADIAFKADTNTTGTALQLLFSLEAKLTGVGSMQTFDKCVPHVLLMLM